MKPQLLEETFINAEEFFKKLEKNKNPSAAHIRQIIAKSLDVNTLSLDEVASLINLEDSDLWEEIFDAALKIKKKVYDNRIVTFAPLYCSNYCINNCIYCGFRKSNIFVERKVLGLEEIKAETEVLAGKIGHKRLIVVFGEHPQYSNINYIAEAIRTIYSVKVKTKNSYSSIRRVNVNAQPLTVEELKILKEVGIGTYQVFQETYHPDTYFRLHPQNTPKSDYIFRLYSMHRAQEAGIDDVGIGVLFGLYDWRFEVLGLVAHAIELEKEYGVGPHTISFPRLEPAFNTPFVDKTPYKVNDADMKKIIAIIRLAVPYTGMIITARETKEFRDEMIRIGITQTDASSKISIGGYSQGYTQQSPQIQQFILGDTRSLVELVRDLAKQGYITSFCTAGYRCGRTGDKIMELLKCGKEALFCKLNAILTFKEWVDDFADDETKIVALRLIDKEINEVKEKYPNLYDHFINYYQRIAAGERDLYF
ncbi:MAG: [FeFe] hydrogenase H-cluster radical SAM maturase HydG [Candidatus Omnitrophica bacterium]|nr:[FeFe] hydrogenase H-cluster radical SAM maturase HydG [Candidatus Omnitrophota bacterium]